MISIHPDLNLFEVMLVQEHYRKRGIKCYTLTKGNDCIWAYHGAINEYFIFRNGQIADIQID
jgi:hypothetical protein